jgi:hypothetical protein
MVHEPVLPARVESYTIMGAAAAVDGMISLENRFLIVVVDGEVIMPQEALPVFRV